MQSSYYCYSQHQTLCLEHLLPESSNSKGLWLLLQVTWFKQVGAEETGLLQAETWWRLVGGGNSYSSRNSTEQSFQIKGNGIKREQLWNRPGQASTSNAHTLYASSRWRLHTHPIKDGKHVQGFLSAVFGLCLGNWPTDHIRPNCLVIRSPTDRWFSTLASR